jgi:demethoxyubiquinone hydroxylase (CLK1/Coq7/Cat5 family)
MIAGELSGEAIGKVVSYGPFTGVLKEIWHHEIDHLTHVEQVVYIRTEDGRAATLATSHTVEVRDG